MIKEIKDSMRNGFRWINREIKPIMDNATQTAEETIISSKLEKMVVRQVRYFLSQKNGPANRNKMLAAANSSVSLGVLFNSSVLLALPVGG